MKYFVYVDYNFRCDSYTYLEEFGEDFKEALNYAKEEKKDPYNDVILIEGKELNID